MSTHADKARALSVRRRLDRQVGAFLEWQAQPSFREASTARRRGIRSEAVGFARTLREGGCPSRLALALASIRYGPAEVTIRRWLRRMDSAPPRATEVPVTKPPGRPRRVWSNPRAEAAFGLYRCLHRHQPKKNSAAIWRAVSAVARPSGLTIPCERTFRLRLRREAAGGR